MKLHKKLLNIVKSHDKRVLFLWSFYMGFLFEMGVAAVLDALTGNQVDVYIDLSFFALTTISFAIYYRTRSIKWGTYSLTLLATLTTYALFISSHYITTIFYTIVPLGYFLLFSFRESFLYTFVHYGIVTLIYLVARPLYPDAYGLHDLFYLETAFTGALMIIIIGIAYHLAIENSFVRLNASNRRNAILLQEIHHRVKNNLNIISSLLGLQQLEQTDPIVHEMLRKNRLRINSIASVHETLYQQGNFEEIDLHDYLHEIAQQVISMYDCQAEITITNKQIKWPFSHVLKLGIITNELIINSIKHAFKAHAGEIIITLENKEEAMTYHYQDSGDTSIDATVPNPSGGLGHHLIAIMVEEMGASMQISTKGGLAYAITIPHR